MISHHVDALDRIAELNQGHYVVPTVPGNKKLRTETATIINQMKKKQKKDSLSLSIFCFFCVQTSRPSFKV
jgi:hypothetical protein